MVEFARQQTKQSKANPSIGHAQHVAPGNTPIQRVLGLQSLLGNSRTRTLLQRRGAGSDDSVEAILAPVRELYQQYEPLNKQMRGLVAKVDDEDQAISDTRWKMIKQNFLQGREKLSGDERKELNALNREDERNPLENQMESWKEKREKSGAMEKYRDQNPERVQLEHQLTAAIGQAREQIKSLPADQRTRAYLELNRLTPFHYQFDNADILWNSGGVAGGRTCNVTVVAMILQGLGKSSGDYKRHNDTRMGAIAHHFGDALQDRGLNPASLTGLPLADYLQLVAVERLIQGEATEKAIANARWDAADAILDSSFLVGILKDFGAAVNTKNHPLAKKLTSFGNKNAAANKKGTPLSKDEKDDMIEEVPVETYKAAFADSIQKELQAGNQVIVNLYNHYVRLQSIEDDGFTVDDPGGQSRESRKITWRDAIIGAYFRKYFVVGQGAVTADNDDTKTEKAAPAPVSSKPAAETKPSTMYQVVDEQALVRSEPPSFRSTGKMIPAGAYVEVTEMMQKKGKKYALVEGYGWTALSNLRESNLLIDTAKGIGQMVGNALGSIVDAYSFDGGEHEKTAPVSQPKEQASAAPTDKPAAAPAGNVNAENAKGLDISKTIIGRLDSEEINTHIETISAELGMDPNIVRGIIAAESGGKTDSGAGKAGYKGLMQAEKTEDQLQADVSIRAGITKFIKFRKQGRQFAKDFGVNGDMSDNEEVALTMVMYNAGNGSVKKAMQYAQEAGNARDWFKDEHFIRSLMYYGAYALGGMKSQIREIGEGDKIAEELTQVSDLTMEQITEKYKKKDGTWNVKALVSRFIEELRRHWRKTREDKKDDRTVEDYEEMANGWLVKAARFKHSNLQKWYVQRVLNYKTYYELQQAMEAKEISDDKDQENDND